MKILPHFSNGIPANLSVKKKTPHSELKKLICKWNQISRTHKQDKIILNFINKFYGFKYFVYLKKKTGRLEAMQHAKRPFNPYSNIN